MWEKHRSAAFSSRPNQDWAASQVCALNGNRTVTFPFAGRSPTNWATPVKAINYLWFLNFIKLALHNFYERLFIPLFSKTTSFLLTLTNTYLFSVSKPPCWFCIFQDRLHCLLLLQGSFIPNCLVPPIKTIFLWSSCDSPPTFPTAQHYADIGHLIVAWPWVLKGPHNLPRFPERTWTWECPRCSQLSWGWSAPWKWGLLSSFFFVCFFKRFYLFSEKGREGGREGERERNIYWLPLTCPQLGTWPTTQACALNPWPFGSQASNPLSHTSQGWREAYFLTRYPITGIPDCLTLSSLPPLSSPVIGPSDLQNLMPCPSSKLTVLQ